MTWNLAPIVWGLAKSFTWILQLRVPDTTRDDMLRERRPNTTVVVLCKMLAKLQQPENPEDSGLGGTGPASFVRHVVSLPHVRSWPWGPPEGMNAASQRSQRCCDAVNRRSLCLILPLYQKDEGDYCWWITPWKNPRTLEGFFPDSFYLILHPESLHNHATMILKGQ